METYLQTGQINNDDYFFPFIYLCVLAWAQRSENSPQQSVLFLHHVQIYVIRLGGKCLHPLNHLTNPGDYFLRKKLTEMAIISTLKYKIHTWQSLLKFLSE